MSEKEKDKAGGGTRISVWKKLVRLGASTFRTRVFSYALGWVWHAI